MVHSVLPVIRRHELHLKAIKTWFKNHRTTTTKPITKLRKDSWRNIYGRENKSKLDAEIARTNPGMTPTDKGYIGEYKKAQKALCEKLDKKTIDEYRAKAEREAATGPPLEEKRKFVTSVLVL